MLPSEPNPARVMTAGSLDSNGRCIVCGRRGEHCAACHRGYEWMRTHEHPRAKALRRGMRAFESTSPESEPRGGA